MIYRLLYKLLHDSADVRDRVGARIYAEYAPASSQGECIVLRLVSGTAANHLGNEADIAERTVQVDFYASTATAAESGFELCRLRLSGYRGTVAVLNSAGTETNLRARINLLRPAATVYAPPNGSDQWTTQCSGDFQVFHSQDVPTHV